MVSEAPLGARSAAQLQRRQQLQSIDALSPQPDLGYTALRGASLAFNKSARDQPNDVAGAYSPSRTYNVALAAATSAQKSRLHRRDNSEPPDIRAVALLAVNRLAAGMDGNLSSPPPPPPPPRSAAHTSVTVGDWKTRTAGLQERATPPVTGSTLRGASGASPAQVPSLRAATTAAAAAAATSAAPASLAPAQFPKRNTAASSTVASGSGGGGGERGRAQSVTSIPALGWEKAGMEELGAARKPMRVESVRYVKKADDNAPVVPMSHLRSRSGGVGTAVHAPGEAVDGGGIQQSHIPPTSALIRLFEEGAGSKKSRGVDGGLAAATVAAAASSSPNDLAHPSPAAPSVTVSSSPPAIVSPKPLRPLSSPGTQLMASLDSVASQPLRKPVKPSTKPPPPIAAPVLQQQQQPSHVRRSVAPSSRLGEQRLDGASAAVMPSAAEEDKSDHPQKTAAAQPFKRVPPPPPPSRRTQGSIEPGQTNRPLSSATPQLPGPPSRNSLSRMPVQAVVKHATADSTSTRPRLLSGLSNEGYTGKPAEIFSAKQHSETRFTGTVSPLRRTPARGTTPYMTEDGLANAIVASSLASSRATSPSKATPPPPLPRRHSKSHFFSHHHHHNHHHELAHHGRPQTTSPSKGLRQTMRKPLGSDDDEAAERRARRRRKKSSFIHKHPNKHHEGARRRWRDTVTERERKRYEGVWAANRGLYVPVNNSPHKGGPAPSQPQQQQRFGQQQQQQQQQQPAAPAEATPNDVVNLVVRDIWSRSRLGSDVLEEIWNLVDRRGIGLLDRQEFTVGLWLIDQRLKGRKLPVKVSLSVWNSVRTLGGIKVPEKRT